MPWKKLVAPCTGLLVVVWVLWCLWLWQPQRQVMLHNAALMRAFEKRDWDRVATLIDVAYADRWGFNRERILRETREVLRQFFTLEIVQESVSAAATSEQGSVHARVRVRGSGTPVAQLAMQMVNGLDTPFLFEWRRRSWKPWDWRLVRVDHRRFDPRAGW